MSFQQTSLDENINQIGSRRLKPAKLKQNRNLKVAATVGMTIRNI